MNSYKNINDLKQNVILRYTKEIDYNDKDSLYEVLIRHLLNGDLNDCYKNNLLDGIDSREKEMLFNKTNKHRDLLLINGDVSSYDESVDIYNVDDKDFVLRLVLDNYDTLMDLVYYGEDIIDEMDNIKDDYNYTFSVIETLRNSFESDKMLIKCMSRFIRENKLYNTFSEKQRVVLYNYPLGIMYEGDKVNSLLEIIVKIYNYGNRDSILVDDLANNVSLFDKVNKYILDLGDKFEDIVISIRDNYYLSIDK